MTVRTTDTLISEILDFDSGSNLTAFISTANAFVTQCCTGSSVETDYEDDVLTLIETWLAAHLYTIKEQLIDTEKAGSVSEKFQYKIDLGFASSRYGQTAMQLDWQGGLSALNEQMKKGKGRRPGVTWLGTSLTEIDE
jgi:hypothetical protein